MCKHCYRLKEDKEVVHGFMIQAAKRLSGILKRTVTPDELRVEISLVEPHPGARLIYDIATANDLK